ncbi:MAG: hypothetical protein IPJ75_09005 [Ignavibacteriales bacterium]|nr:hypothetical protein [Ignavibacteriales bacterium]
MPGIGVIGQIENVPFQFTPTARGTFSAISFVTSPGDSVSSNDTIVNNKILVYPDSAIYSIGNTTTW